MNKNVNMEKDDLNKKVKVRGAEFAKALRPLFRQNDSAAERQEDLYAFLSGLKTVICEQAKHDETMLDFILDLMQFLRDMAELEIISK